MTPTATSLNGGHQNGHAAASRSQQLNLPRGIYVPVVTPFLSKEQDEAVDIPALQNHCSRLADAGCGIVLMGTNGEGELWRLPTCYNSAC